MTDPWKNAIFLLPRFTHKIQLPRNPGSPLHWEWEVMEPKWPFLHFVQRWWRTPPNAHQLRIWRGRCLGTTNVGKVYQSPWDPWWVCYIQRSKFLRPNKTMMGPEDEDDGLSWKKGALYHQTFRWYLKRRDSWSLFSTILGVGGFTPLHKPYPYSLYRWGYLHL